MPGLVHDGLVFRYYDQGAGAPLLFQHGLGADGLQSVELCAPLAGTRVLALDSRAHGGTFPLGPDEKISLAQSADDLCALLDRLEIARAVVGGISMGAAIALSFAFRHPARVSALILSRPAWLDRAFPPNLELYPVIAQLLRTRGPERGLEEFRRSDQHVELEQTYPASAESLRSQFREPRALEAVIRLERIPHDTPSGDPRAWAAIGVPTLVLANRQDLIHPFAYGEELAQWIPSAEFRELTPKAVSTEAHLADARAAIGGFLARLRI